MADKKNIPLDFFVKLKYSVSSDIEFYNLLKDHCIKIGSNVSRFLNGELALFIKSRSGSTAEELLLKSNAGSEEEARKLFADKCGVENFSKEFCENVKRRIEANE